MYTHITKHTTLFMFNKALRNLFDELESNDTCSFYRLIDAILCRPQVFFLTLYCKVIHHILPLFLEYCRMLP